MDGQGRVKQTSLGELRRAEAADIVCVGHVSLPHSLPS